VAVCPNCGHGNAEGAKFCSECGIRLDAVAETPRDVRKTVTVVFCDVTGSTSLGERLDPESLRTVMSRYFDRMQAVLESHGGTVEKFIGDAVMAVFGIPVLHEDDAVRAVRAAGEMRSALADLNTDLEREWSVAIQTRIGINTGPVVAGDPTTGQALVTGDAVNTAARLEQAAEPGEILIGEETFGLARDAIEAEAVDPLPLKGKADTVGAYRLFSVRPGVAGHERRLDSPMVGRDLQLRMLLDAFEAATTEETCHLFTVMGPAGIGKSRLVREFVSSIGARAQVLTGRCLSYGEGITFWPIEEMALQAAGITEDASPEEARAELRGLLEDSPDGETVAAHLAGMLGLDGSGPVEPSWAVRCFLEALGRRRPVVAVFDDIHWGEPTLLEIIEHVAAWSRDVPILLVCMARPELLEERPGWGGGQRNTTSVHLEPLSEPEADALIENLLGHPALTQDIRKRIRAAANGNPLFVEEMLSMLVDDAILVQKDGEWVATVDLSVVQVPPAISALLASRLDRLPPDERRVVEAAAVVGEVFDHSAVAALVPQESGARLDMHLDMLLLKDIVRPSPSDVGGSWGLRFRHILLRDAAYDAIPKAERATLHEAFAEHLQASLADRIAEFDEFIGYHLEQAHRMREELGIHDERTASIGRAAFEHLRGAGRRALQRGDMATASVLLGRATTLLGPNDPDRLRLSWEWGWALLETGSFAEAAPMLADSVRRAESIGDQTAAAYARCMATIVSMLSDPQASVADWEAVADRLIGYFDKIGDPRGAALAWAARTYSLWMKMRADECERAAERAVEHARAAGDRLLDSDMTGQRLSCLVWGPTPVSRGLVEAELIYREAIASGNRRLEQSALRVLAFLHAHQGGFEEARELFARAGAILLELGQSVEYAGTSMAIARMEMWAGDIDAAARVLLEACQALQGFGETGMLSTAATVLAEVQVTRGDPTDAERWIAVSEQTGQPDDLATQSGIQRARGIVLAYRGETAAAESGFRSALDLVEGSDFSVDRAEVRLDLARLLGADRRSEAIALTREALALSESKEASVVSDGARALLAELEHA
jgi:class 3 adenylate cyclase/tetratricopeptide (TPR) repeat protein